MQHSKSSRNNDWIVALLSISGAFITYFSMYAFRKPFTAAQYADMVLWGIDYKILLITTQVAGYTLSKFIGIKVISEMRPEVRIRSILLLIGVSWLALLFFGLVPYPYQFICLFFNGLPLGMIWGIVFAFLEGRRLTELLAAGLSASFIVSSGFVKSIGLTLILNGVTEAWMPFFTGLIFIPTLLLGVWLLSKIPPPSAEDEADRTKREPMSYQDRRRFFISFAPGIILVILLYMALNAYRDFRDNFAVEIWAGLGYAEEPAVLTFSEIPIAVTVLIIISLMMFVKNHRIAFYSNLLIIGIGGAYVLFTTFLATNGYISNLFWMISVGFGMYLAYLSYHTMLFERWIALFKYQSNIGFLMYLADSTGYLASVAVLIYKNFFLAELSWLSFFVNMSYGMGTIALTLSILSIIYFWVREKKSPKEPEVSLNVSAVN